VAANTSMRRSIALAARWRTASRSVSSSVRRSDLDGYHACQPAPPVVGIHGLCAALRVAPDWIGSYAVCPVHLLHYPPECPSGDFASHLSRLLFSRIPA
jgi:hypothetical protein